MRTLLCSVMVATVLVASQQPAAPFDPVGKWTYETQTEEGTSTSGTMEITGTPGAYTGRINTGDGAQIPIVDVATSPKGMILLGDLPDGAVVVRVMRDASGTLTAAWGPVRPVIPAKVSRVK